MSSYKKNLIVGVTVLAALVLLGWMILRFSDAPFRLFAKEQITVHFRTVSAEGVGEGTPVYYLGVGVGRVTRLRRSEDPSDISVIIDANLDAKPPLPQNIEGLIRSQILGGTSSISLVRVMPRSPATHATQPAGEDVIDQENIPPVGELKSGTFIETKFLGIDIIPRKEFAELAVSLTHASDEFRLTARQIREERIVPKLGETIDTLRGQIEHAGKVIESVNSLVSDQKMRQDIQQTLANFRTASESANQIAQNVDRLTKKADTRFDEVAGNANKVLETTNARVDELSRQLTGRLEQIAKVLENIELASRKINEGNGTAGRLINDPALYENLLDVSKELKASVGAFRRVLEQWEQEGVPFKLR